MPRDYAPSPVFPPAPQRQGCQGCMHVAMGVVFTMRSARRVAFISGVALLSAPLRTRVELERHFVTKTAGLRLM